MSNKPATHTVTNPIDPNEFFQRKSPRVYTHAIVIIDTQTSEHIDKLIASIQSNEAQLAKTLALAAAAPEKTIAGRYENPTDPKGTKWIDTVFGADHYNNWADRLRDSIDRGYDRLAQLRRDVEAGKADVWCAGWSQSEANAHKAAKRWAGPHWRQIQIIPCRRSGTGIITSS